MGGFRRLRHPGTPERNDGDHVGGTHARMYAGVASQVYCFGRYRHLAEQIVDQSLR
jgi:hypothetical protein